MLVIDIKKESFGIKIFIISFKVLYMNNENVLNIMVSMLIDLSIIIINVVLSIEDGFWHWGV